MPPERADWVEASVLIESIDSAVLDFLALGAEVEVLRPLELRHELAETALRIAELHSPSR
jgi:predicted DNA-binding transcriptional regulator YafY